MENIRMNIIKEILDTFGVYNYSVTAPLARGESLADFLKGYVVICPQEYNSFLTCKTGTLGELADSLNLIVTCIRKKQRIYRLYEEYCRCFLGERISSVTLDSITSEVDYHLNLRDENGHIDYTPYLTALGIDNPNEISRQYISR